MCNLCRNWGNPRHYLGRDPGIVRSDRLTPLYQTNQCTRLYLIPGGPGRLERVCLGEDNLLLVYADDRARLWDVKTQEFWRSMTREKAEELLEQGGWFEACVPRELHTVLPS